VLVKTCRIQVWDLDLAENSSFAHVLRSSLWPKLLAVTVPCTEGGRERGAERRHGEEIWLAQDIG